MITVVDSAAVSVGRFADNHDRVDQQRQADESLDHDSPLEELFEDQLTAADLIILNKADLLDDAELDAVRAEVSRRVPRNPNIITSREGQVSPKVLLGLGMETENHIDQRKPHHELEHEAAHEVGEEHHHDHDEFESFVVEADSISNQGTFTAALRRIIAEHDILRLKGFAHLPGKPMRLVIQAVGDRIDFYFDRLWKDDERCETRLVVIGLHDIDQAGIGQAVRLAATQS